MVPLIGFSKLHLILALPNLLAHYNKTISYYVQVNSLWLKSNVASKWASKKLWGPLFFFFFFAVDGADGALCSAIRYQEKIYLFLDLNFMYMGHMQNHIL